MARRHVRDEEIGCIQLCQPEGISQNRRRDHGAETRALIAWRIKSGECCHSVTETGTRPRRSWHSAWHGAG